MQAINEIIDELLGNDSLKASPYVWHKLCEIKELSAAAPEVHVIKFRTDIDKNEFLKAFEAAKKNLTTFIPCETTGWIPVAERLPEDAEDVIATTSDGDVRTGWYNAKKGWCVNDNYWPNAFDFIAWMPLALPDPYKEEEDENG